ncbi:MAG: hypothetical protein ACP5RJ_03460 [Conexivisphaera sp.]
MRARWAVPISIVLLLLSALHSYYAILEAANRIGTITYYTYLSGLPLPYLRTFLSAPGGSPEYTEVLTVQLAVDELFWLAVSCVAVRALQGRRTA